MSGLETVEREWLRIVQEGDVEAAEGFLAPDFVLTSIGGVAPNATREEWLDMLPKIETRAFHGEEFEAREWGDTAIVRLKVYWDASIGDRDLSGEYAIVDVFRRVDGVWKASWRISQKLTA